MGRMFHHYHSVTPEQRRRATLNGCARRHGLSVVYIDGEPLVLQHLAKEMGCTVKILYERARKARLAGRTITKAALTAPVLRPRGKTPA